MSSKLSKRGLVIITGAAGGLGQAFARKLAARGHSLWLVDRRQAELEQVCQSIRQEYSVAAEPYAADFCRRAEVEQLAQRIKQLPDVELLVNNAGFGSLNHFVDTDPSLFVGMLDVHVAAPMLLTHAVLPGMLQRNSGAIINVSSVSAWFHSAGNAHYGSTKICLAVFTATLNEELRGTNVRVQALCPGFVRTQFHQAESMKDFQRFSPAANMWAAADEVVECSLRRLSRKQVIVIPGFGYRIIGRLAQMPVLQPLMRRITRVPRTTPASPTPASPTPASPTPALAVEAGTVRTYAISRDAIENPSLEVPRQA
jgi:uncharacterized protein